MKLNEYMHFHPPTIYDLIVTIGMVIACSILWNVKITQGEVLIAQEEMKKNQITKEYLFEFYITRNQILYIEAERNRTNDFIRNGTDPKVEEAIFLKRVDELFKLRDRGK